MFYALVYMQSILVNILIYFKMTIILSMSLTAGFFPEESIMAVPCPTYYYYSLLTNSEIIESV